MLRQKFVRHWSGELTSQLAAIALVFQAFLVGLGHGADAQAMAMSPAVPGAAELVICTADSAPRRPWLRGPVPLIAGCALLDASP
jgi:hypothetical protein